MGYTALSTVLRRLANQIKPFLFKEDDIELVLNAALYAERFLRYEAV